MRALPLALCLALAAACGPRPLVRDLGRDALPAAGAPRPDRGCRLALTAVRDARPVAEQRGDGLTAVGVLIPLPILFVSSTSGVDVADPDHLGGERLARDVEAGLRAVLSRGGPCALVADAAAATHTLEVELEHLYGLNAYRSLFWFSYGAAGSASTDFYPAGQASLGMQLRSNAGGEVRALHVASGRLFEPGGEADASFSATGVGASTVENNRTLQVVAALRDALGRVPAELDRALAEEGVGGADGFDRARFTILRQLADLEHVERATIEYASGRVLDVEVVRRDAPLVSGPDEWVVSPDQPGALTAGAYARLLEHLSARYAIARGDNLSAAGFGGLLEHREAEAGRAAGAARVAEAGRAPAVPAAAPALARKKARGRLASRR